MDFEAVYKVVTQTVIVVGWIGGAVWLSVHHHLGRHSDEGWIAAIIILPIVAGMVWPAAPFIGFFYLVHKGIGYIVKFSQRSKLTPDNRVTVDDGVIFFADPDLVNAEREVEEICNEATS